MKKTDLHMFFFQITGKHGSKLATFLEQFLRIRTIGKGPDELTEETRRKLILWRGHFCKLFNVNMIREQNTLLLGD